MSGYTKGPWQISAPRGNGTARTIWRSDGDEENSNWECIARDVHVDANARLIAAAPDMLEALRVAREALGANAARDAVDAAIAKAEGK